MPDTKIVPCAPLPSLRQALVALSLAAVSVPVQAARPRDEAGWTIFRPADASRIVFVSASRGDDKTARAYSSKEIDDPFGASDTVKAFRTFEAAYAATRAAMPDWILLRRGDTLGGSLRWRSGASEAEPFLIGAYGKQGPSPLVRTGTASALEICCKSFSHLVLTGIDFVAEGRAYGHPGYVSSGQASGFSVYVGEGFEGRDLHVEGCRFSWYSNNTLQSAQKGGLGDVVVRRCGFFDNYSTTAHAQGLYAANLVGMELEENLFDHNGWFKRGDDNRKDSGMATIFNHDTYFAGCHSVAFRRNMFLRGSSIGTKWTANGGPGSSSDLVIEDNLYADNEVAISIGGNAQGPHRFRNVRIAGNVLTHPGRSRQTDRELGWGIEVKEWDSGSVRGNVLVHGRSAGVTNVWALSLGGSSRKVTIADNVVWGWRGTSLVVDTATTRSEVVVESNRFEIPGDAGTIASIKSGSKGVVFKNNKWIQPNGPTFRLGTTTTKIDGWIASTGETGATTSADALPDTTRGIETYQKSNGRPATMETFIEDIRKQSRTSWRTPYSAAAVNRWIRAGFVRDASTDVARGRIRSTGTGAMRIESVFGGRIRSREGHVEIRTLQGRLLHRGMASQAVGLPDGPVAIRPLTGI